MHKLAKIWRKYVTKPTKFQGSKMPLKYAFTVNGVDYFEPDPDQGGLKLLPWERMLTLQQFYQELTMNVDREYLIKHTEAVDFAIRGPKDKPKTKLTLDDMVEFSKLNAMLLERLKLIYVPDLVYKVASAVFIDESESPELYNEEYNAKKIEGWQAAGMGSFFLNEPVQRLMPHLNFSHTDFLAYGEQAKILTEKWRDEVDLIYLDYTIGQLTSNPA